MCVVVCMLCVTFTNVHLDVCVCGVYILYKTITSLKTL